MALVYLVALQAAAPAQPPGGAAPRPEIRFDLRDVPPPSGCTGTGGDEILVCGRRDDESQRLQALPPEEASGGLPQAETRLFGNVRGRVYLDQVEMQQGLQSRRVMFGVRVPF